MVGSAGEKVMQVGRGTVFPYKESILRRREVGGLMRREIHLRMVRHVALLAVVALSAVVVLVFLHANGGATATLRSEFDDRSVTPIFSPIDLAFAPDGRMLIATQPGLLRVHKDGELLQTPALDLTGKVCSNSERGLLGVALDPSFSTNRYVYLYYTFNKFGECPVYDTHNLKNPVNRVSRFVMSGDTIDPSSEKVLIDNIPSPSRHNSGDLSFGKNGYLYVSVGDGGRLRGRLGLPDQQRRLPRPHVLLARSCT
jgi:Glucose / Sorbosone dehydrogenase